MKQLLISLATILFFANMSCSQSSPILYTSKSFANADINSVKAQTSGGSILTEGVQPSESKVEVYVNSNNGKNLSKEEIEKIINENYSLEIGQNGKELSVIAKPKNALKSNQLSISFKIYCPAKAGTDLKTSGGSISIKNLSGKQVFSTSGGSLNIENISGEVDGRTSGGSINVSNCKSNNIVLKTSGGSIKAANCTGPLDLKTSGGSLQLENLTGPVNAATSGGSIKGGSITGNLVAHTSGGSIKFDKLSGSLDASTTGGSMEISMTSVQNFVKLSNSAGSIKLELPKSLGYNVDLKGSKVSVDNARAKDVKATQNSWQGKMNDGGIPVTVKSGAGSVNLTLK